MLDEVFMNEIIDSMDDNDNVYCPKCGNLCEIDDVTYEESHGCIEEYHCECGNVFRK